MDFGSIRRKNRISQPSRRNKTFSSSNLSCISCNSASVSSKRVYVTLPKDFGCDIGLDGRIVHMRKGSPAHAVGVIQIGDYLRIVEHGSNSKGENDGNGVDDEIVQLQVTFGVLQVESRPNCPLAIEIGNRSHTSLGIALADSLDNKIHISSIQPGSLADRCGYLKPGDMLTSIYINGEETIACSPYYSSFQIAQILRQLTSRRSSIKLTIVPGLCKSSTVAQCHHNGRPNSGDDMDSGGSDSTLTLGESDNGSICNPSTFNGKTFSSTLHPPKRQIEKVDELEEEGGVTGCVLSLCLWKDPLYEDWGFSLVDDSEADLECDEATFDTDMDNAIQMKLLHNKQPSHGATVYQIRPNGPAYVAGLKPSDRIMEINGRDVSKLESTMLVPILASLENAMNLVIVRDTNANNSNDL